MSESMKFRPRFLTLRTFLATQPVLFGALLVLVLLIACEPYVPGSALAGNVDSCPW